MKKITLNNSKNSLTNLEIENFEKKNNFTFPVSYKKFLLIGNGGVPKENIFWDGEIESDVSFFYSLIYGSNNIESVLENLHREDALPKTFFPFASTGGGSIYAFSMREDSFEEVYLFHFDGSEPLKLCNTFKEFINNLEEDE
ncbi:SMI1/KNR4 family protein [Tenacibaculum sp. XPcli2-G]|uniref:SMI1/KNR4 family protein n=1 Tax=unclassified Tenacibaculum TaxID=2635139 RepID=UPI002096D97E|nr:SMI1/KNR4 family protein [Tenacibaculum sp. XPcli2-G]MCO7184130.1 SMI1/KNR4 family protein [Tenacibaculum sp. XPcli2-G]